MNEREAISRFKAGDMSGLEVLVRLYQTRALRVAYLVTHDRHLSEDVVQSAFIRVFERRRQFDDSRPFGPWFFRIVANDAAKAQYRRQREVSSSGRPGWQQAGQTEELIDSTPSVEELVEQSMMRERVWEAIEELSPEQRAALVLRYYMDMKQEEVAQELGRPLGTAKWLLHTARRRLKRLLAPGDESPHDKEGPG